MFFFVLPQLFTGDTNFENSFFLSKAGAYHVVPFKLVQDLASTFYVKVEIFI